MNTREIAKKTVNVVVGLGTTKIVADVIANNTNVESKTDKVKVTAGSLVLGSMAADMTTSYTDRKIDEIADWWTTNVTNRIPTKN